MSEAIQNRRITQDNIKSVQQEKADKKRELVEQSRQEMKAVKAKYKELSHELDQETSAAINHIKTGSEEDREELRAQQAEAKAAVYNRKGAHSNGQIKSSSNSRKSAPEVEKVSHDDPFYKVQDRGSRISESSNGYTIKAYVPEHEKDNLRMAVANDRAVLSGKRKFQDSVEDEDKKISTNNFQTFHEEFKFDRPVVSEGITRERDGEFIKFFIPKLESVRFDEET